jgi:hypothetical protein
VELKLSFFSEELLPADETTAQVASITCLSAALVRVGTASSSVPRFRSYSTVKRAENAK